MITLAKIKQNNPCADGWEQILEAQGPELDREWPLVEALESNGLDHVLWALRCLPEYSDLWRKYAVWCALQVEHLMTNQRSKDAMEVAWKHSDGQATDSEMTEARAAAREATFHVSDDAAACTAEGAAAEAAAEAARYSSWAAAGAAKYASLAAIGAARYAAWAAAWAAADAAAEAAAESAASKASYEAWASARMAAKAAQEKKLREIFAAGEWV